MKSSLEKLQLEYVDLYLLHCPFAFADVKDNLQPYHENGDIMMDVITDHVKIWSEMEKQVDCGRARAIGLSNFNSRQIERVLKNARLQVSMLQIELHIYFQQKEMVSALHSVSINL